eukprot:scaffold1420_cov79-Skeletonema_marinoi.AAC.2
MGRTNLLSFERVDTSMNMADHFSKQLPPTLIARHVDHILGHVPRTRHKPSHCWNSINSPYINTIRISSASQQ